MVVDHLTAESTFDHSGVACIYLNHKEAEDHTPAKLLASLWRQLVVGKDLGADAKNLYDWHFERNTSPTYKELFDMLHSCLTEFSRVYIVVDGVDEYPEDKRNMLLGYFGMMGPSVNLMITSRPHITPPSSFPNLHSLEIRASKNDVRSYVDARIQSSTRLSKHVQRCPDLREQIHSHITCIVDGM
jgi:hypothetical protein